MSKLEAVRNWPLLVQIACVPLTPFVFFAFLGLVVVIRGPYLILYWLLYKVPWWFLWRHEDKDSWYSTGDHYSSTDHYHAQFRGIFHKTDYENCKGCRYERSGKIAT